MRSLKSSQKRVIAQKAPWLSLDKKANLQYDEKAGAYFLDGSLVLIEDGDDLIPYLKARPDFSGYPSAIIDMPAVPFMVRGADLLRPGVVSYDAFAQGSIVVVRDERNGAALALMRALIDSSELEAMEKGKVAKSLHYVGDRWWSAY
jgi:malignant T-cell-amplified sequence